VKIGGDLFVYLSESKMINYWDTCTAPASSQLCCC